MKLKLRLNKSTIDFVQEELLKKEIEIAEDAKLILTEEDYTGETIECKDAEGIVYVNTEDICYMESVGHDVYVHTNDRKYRTKYRIYQLEGLLPPDRFIRISNSIIIKRNAIRHIKPALSSKFYLTLKTGDVVDVTRTYFHKFKEFYGI